VEAASVGGLFHDQPCHQCDPPHCRLRSPVASIRKEMVLFEQEADMSDGPLERELSMDELDLVGGGGAIVPLAHRARQFANEHADRGVQDDSV
jgi:hypothetical protein